MNRKSLKRILVSILMITMLAIIISGCSSNDVNNNNSATPRTVVDMNGDSIVVPETVDSYIVLWKSYTSVFAMLDNCKGLAGCDYDVTSAKDAWLFEICEDAKDIKIVTEEITPEQVAEMDVDVVFWQNDRCAELASQLNDLGIAAVNINFTDYDSMKKSISVAAETLGTDEAKAKAQKYNKYLDSVIGEITAVSNNIPEADKVSVLNLRSLETMRADGRDTVADAWIEGIGAINVVGAEGLTGNQNLVLEQIYEWDPDIIVTSVVGDDAAMYADKNFAQLSAIKNKKIYIDPYGIFSWNRYSAETPLQLYWAASTFYPDLFSDIDIKEKVVSFYSEFFGYDISDENVNNILGASAPKDWKN